MGIFQHIGGPAIVIFIGVVISAGGAIWAAYEQSVSENVLRTKSEEIAILNKKIADSIIGGDSFAYIAPTFFKDKNNPPYLTLVHQGEHPIYDLSIRIVDLDEFEQQVKNGYTIADLHKKENQFNVGNLSTRQASMLGTISIPESGMRLNIFFSARNGFFSESLRVKKVNNEWKTAIKVENTPTSGEIKVLYEKIDIDFPLNKEGEVEW